MSDNRFKAVIADLDGVITRTADLHARAWKEMFDGFLAEYSRRKGVAQAPFEVETDYRRYVDGRPRYDGVASFLESRGIQLPRGAPDDAPTVESVCGLGNRKNSVFLDLLASRGVVTYDDALEQVRRWRGRKLRLALITSSRNGMTVVERAGLRDMFDAIVDGAESARMGLKGKPAPDIFLEAARRLDVQPANAIVLEDAIAGVEAGRRGGFGLVVGVARHETAADELRAAGADMVVRDVRQVSETTGAGAGRDDESRHALEAMQSIDARLDGRKLAAFLDYDGTLTPIVRRPELAVLSEEMRALLRELSRRSTVAVVSGRDLDDVRGKVALDNLYYAGSHGFDVAGPGGLRMQQEEALQALPDLDAVEEELRERLRDVGGAFVERKKFAIAVHYREVADQDVPRVEPAVDEVLRDRRNLRKRGGKKIFEIQPDVPWDKGRAVLWLLENLDLDSGDVVPMYVGDDTTDEDAFQALGERGLTIRVGEPDEPTLADFYLNDVAELARFFGDLLRLLDRKGGLHG